MKKSTLFVSSFFLLTTLFSPTPSHAIFGNFLNFHQEIKSENANVKAETQAEIKIERQKNKNEEPKNSPIDRKNQGLDNRRSKAQATLKRLRQGIVSRYENTLKLKTKIESRFAQGNFIEAKAKLATFSDAKYKSDLVSFDAKTSLVLTSDTPLKFTPELKDIAKSLQSDIKAMRQILADTLRLIIKAR